MRFLKLFSLRYRHFLSCHSLNLPKMYRTRRWTCTIAWQWTRCHFAALS